MRTVRLFQLMLIGFCLVALLGGSAHAGPFVGSPPLPAHESTWILLDGGDAAAKATIEMAASFAQKTLQLEANKSLFRFSPTTHDISAVEKSFARSGPLGRMLLQVEPAVVVMIVNGLASASGLQYGSGMISPEWLDNRVQEVTSLCPSALVVVLIESAPVALGERILDMSKARKSPLTLLAGTADGAIAHTAPRADLLMAVMQTTKDDSLKGAVPELFKGPPNDRLNIITTMFLTALLGAADDKEGNGYDIIEVENWLKGMHGKVTGTLGGAKEGMVIVHNWGTRKDAGVAPGYPLKRQKYTIGICVAHPPEKNADRAARMMSELRDLTRALEGAVRGALPQAPKAILVAVFDPTMFPASSKLPQAVCAQAEERNRFDTWVDLFRTDDGHFILVAARTRTREIVVAPSREPLSLEQARAQMAATGRDIVKPVAIYNPIPEAEIIKSIKSDVAPEATLAKQQFDLGESLFKKGNFEQASVHFRRSNDTSPTPEALFSVALCDEQLNRFPEAEKRYEQLIKKFPTNSPMVLAAKQRLEVLKQKRQTSEERSRASRSTRLVAGYTVGSIGILGLGIGVATGAVALAKKNELSGSCPVPKQCTVEGEQLEGKVRSLANASTAAFVVGVAALGAGLVLVLTSTQQKRPAAALRLNVGSVEVAGEF